MEVGNVRFAKPSGELGQKALERLQSAAFKEIRLGDPSASRFEALPYFFVLTAEGMGLHLQGMPGTSRLGASHSSAQAPESACRMHFQGRTGPGFASLCKDCGVLRLESDRLFELNNSFQRGLHAAEAQSAIDQIKHLGCNEFKNSSARCPAQEQLSTLDSCIQQGMPSQTSKYILD